MQIEMKYDGFSFSLSTEDHKKSFAFSIHIFLQISAISCPYLYGYFLFNFLAKSNGIESNWLHDKEKFYVIAQICFCAFIMRCIKQGEFFRIYTKGAIKKSNLFVNLQKGH